MKSIRTKGMIFSFILIFIAVSVTVSSGYYRFKHILQGEINNAVERVATESAAHLSNYLNQFVTPLINMSRHEKITSMDWIEQREILDNQINENYLNVAVVDRKAVAHYLDESIIDLSDREYIQDALSGKVTFSEVIISRKTNTPVIMAATPIIKDNEVKGALIARLNVDFLSDYALTRGYGENGRAYIISEEGSFISRPQQESMELSYNLFELAMENNSYRSLMEFTKSTNDKAIGYGKYHFENENIFMGYASVENTNWKIYIGTYESEALESLNNLERILLLLSIITMAISILAAYAFVSKFTKPIEEMDRLFSLGARGNLTIRFTPSTKDEIGRLGVSFNVSSDPKMAVCLEFERL